MLRKRVIPCLLLEGKGLVKTIKFKDSKYIGDPINACRIFNDKEVDELIILDITATKKNEPPNFDLIYKITSECFMPLAIGGGIKSIDHISQLFKSGVEKAVINSYAIENLDFIKKAYREFGSQSIVVAIDVKKNWKGGYDVYTHSATKKTSWDPIELSVQIESMGAGEILINSIDRDGTMQGYDIEIIQKVSNSLSIPVIASGGAGSINDFSDVVKIGGASAVAAGSIFIYYGQNRAVLINYPTQDEIDDVWAN